MDRDDSSSLDDTAMTQASAATREEDEHRPTITDMLERAKRLSSNPLIATQEMQRNAALFTQASTEYINGRFADCLRTLATFVTSSGTEDIPAIRLHDLALEGTHMDSQQLASFDGIWRSMSDKET